MNPDIQHPTRLRALALWLGLAVLTAGATAQTTPSPTTPAPAADADKPKEIPAEETTPAKKTIAATETTKAIKLEEYNVLGSRIRQTESEGPSPVTVYTREAIDSTGAMTLAQFLRNIPQNYMGASAGRGSVPNEFNPEFGVRTDTSFPSTPFNVGSSTVTPGQSGISSVGLRGLGAGSTLVMIDGRRAVSAGEGNKSTDSRQGFVDINSIPLAMIDRIEVLTDGASAVYGSDAVGGVVNIVLKKDYVGTEISGTYQGTWHGGGRERDISLTSGFAKGKLSGMVGISYYDRTAINASERNISKNQDHRSEIYATDANGNPVFGRDYRIPWGIPATVQARTGNLNGVLDPNGNPTRIALTPQGATTTPAVGQFIGVAPTPPATLANALSARFYNSADALDLVAPTQRRSASLNATYKFNDRIEAYFSYIFSGERNQNHGQYPVTPSGTSSGFGAFLTLVPAAFNPFGQDVVVGMVHYEFGPQLQTTDKTTHRGLIGVRGKFGRTWEWDSGFSYQREVFNRTLNSLNTAKWVASLSAADASQRFNPFIDPRAAGPVNAHLYPAMTDYQTFDSESWLATWDFSANGTIYTLPGGDVKVAVGGEVRQQDLHSVTAPPAPGYTPIVDEERTPWAAYGEAVVPIFGKPNAVPLLYRLELNAAARYEDDDNAGAKTNPKYGAVWSPVKPVLFRASYAESFRAPSLTEYQNTNSTGPTSVNDPKRTPTATTVTAIRGSNPDVKPETGETRFAGVIVEPPFIKGLTFEINYYETVQNNVIISYRAQDLVNNEAAFPDRVIRGPQTADDITKNQPGAITTVDITTGNFGQVRNESIDYVVNYTLPWKDLGKWQLSFNASNTREASHMFRPGVPAVDENGDTQAAPEWSFLATAYWNWKNFSGAAAVHYIGAFGSNTAGNSNAPQGYPAHYTVDLRGTYTFKEGVWRGYGKGVKIGAGIGNVFDREPPQSNTIYGYNGGLYDAAGRTYQFLLTVPL